MTVLAVADVAYVRANWGRWIADCPSGYCRNALQVWPGDSGFACGECGRDAPLVWPADPDAIEHLLAMRSDAITRNWEPGELLEDLMVENAEHFCTPPEWEELAAAQPNGQLQLMTTDEGRVNGGLLFIQLAASRTKAELEAAPREDIRGIASELGLPWPHDEVVSAPALRELESC